MQGKDRRKKNLLRLWMDQAATELVEFALVLPLLAMVLFGMWWFGRAFNIYETITRAAREGASYGARPNAALDSQICNTENPHGFPCTSDIEQKIAPMLQAAHINPDDLLVTSQPTLPGCQLNNGFNPNSPCPYANNNQPATCYNWNKKIWVCRCVGMQGRNQNFDAYPECGVAVTMTYPWKFRFPFTGLDNFQINIPVTVQERQEF